MAVRAELRRDLIAEADRFVADLIAEVGPPSAEQLAEAKALARRLARRPALKAG